MLHKLLTKYKQKQNLSVALIYLLILFLLSLYRTNLIAVNLFLLITGIGIFYNNIYLGMVFLFLWFVGSLYNKDTIDLEKFETIKETPEKFSTKIDSDDINLKIVLENLLTKEQIKYLNRDKILETNNIKYLEDLVYKLKNNYFSKNPQIVTFCYLYRVYLFSIGKCIELINNNKIIVSFKDTKKTTLQTEIEFLKEFYKNNQELLTLKEKSGIEYYLGQKNLKDGKKNPYYILELLDLEKDFKKGNSEITKDGKQTINYLYQPEPQDYKETIDKLYKDLKKKSKNEHNGGEIKKILESSESKNFRMKKEYYELMVLFHYYEYFNEDEFTIIEPYKTLKKIKEAGNVTPIFVKYDIAKRATVSYFNYLKSFVNESRMIDFTKTGSETGNYETTLKQQYDKLLKGEYKKIEGLSEYKKDSNKVSEIKKIDFNEIGKGLTKTCVDIINEIVELFSKEKTEGFVDSKDSDINDDITSYSNFFERYLYYFKEIVKILTKEGRMFNVGVILLMVSILMVFIESSK